MSVTLTGVPDADRLILLNLDNRSLASACRTDKYVSSLCNNDLWRLKLNRLLGGDVVTNNPKLLYRELVSRKTDERRLVWAAVTGNDDIIRLLLDNRVVPMDQAEIDLALSKAATFGHNNTIQLLLDKGADINADNDNAFLMAVFKDHINTIQLLIDNGANIHTNNDRALRWASEYSLNYTVRILLSNGADLHVGNDQPLRGAAEKGNTETLRILLDNGADIHDEALLSAAENGHTSTVRLLLDYGADMHARNDLALKLATRGGYKDIVKLLTPYMDALDAEKQCAAITRAGTRCKLNAKGFVGVLR